MNEVDMPRVAPEKMEEIYKIACEMDELIESGNWTQEAFQRLRSRAHETLPGLADAWSFLIRAADPDWLSDAYRAHPIKEEENESSK